MPSIKTRLLIKRANNKNKNAKGKIYVIAKRITKIQDGVAVTEYSFDRKIVPYGQENK